MFFVLLLLFTVLPALEIYLLILIGTHIGGVETVLCVIGTGIAGAALARSQGFRVLQEIQIAMARGMMPGKELLHGALVLAGGIVLLTPGFLTDFIGLCLLIPPIRALVVKILMHYLKRKLQTPTISVDYREL